MAGQASLALGPGRSARPGCARVERHRDDAGEDQAWTSNPQLSWYQAAADTLIDSGIRIRGAGDYHEVGDSVFLEPFGDTMSAGAWVNVASFPTTAAAPAWFLFVFLFPGGRVPPFLDQKP